MIYDVYILRNIFRFLDFSDRYSVIFTCKYWNENRNYVGFNNNIMPYLYYIKAKILKEDEWIQVYKYYKYQCYSPFPDPLEFDKNGIHNLLSFSSENGYLEIVKLLLEDEQVDPSDDNNYALKLACESGHLEIVRLLLEDKRVDPSDSYYSYDSLAIASEKGHLDIVELLIYDERADPSADNNMSIRLASKNGHLDIVDLLFYDERVDPSDYDDDALYSAVDNNHYEIVKLLLTDKRVDPSVTNNRLLFIAIYNKYYKIVELLFEDERIDDDTKCKYSLELIRDKDPIYCKNGIIQSYYNHACDNW